MAAFSPAGSAIFNSNAGGLGNPLADDDEERRKKLLAQLQQKLLPNSSAAGTALGLGYGAALGGGS